MPGDEGHRPSIGPNQWSRAKVVVTDAGWSSSVARRAHNPEVAGSNPVPATNTARYWSPIQFGSGILFTCVLLPTGHLGIAHANDRKHLLLRGLNREGRT